jgi:DNA polymerase
MIATMDYETYSEAGYKFDPALGRFVPIQKGKPGIKGINAAVYAEHPSTEVINLAYDLVDGRGERLWLPGMGAPQDLFDYIAVGGLIEAHNSGFEYYIWYHVCHKRLGWPPLPLDQLRCSAAKARAWSLPGALGKLSEVLNPTEKKDKRGEQLIQLLSIPKKPTKVCAELRRTREKYPELYGDMFRYGIQDVVSEKSISAMIPELHPQELELWKLDQRINTWGVAIDTEGLANCTEIFGQAEQKYTDELKRITGGAVSSVGEMTKNSAGDKWMISQGATLSSLDKKHVEEALERTDLPPAVHRALEIRQIIGSASVKKLFAMDRCVSGDGRLRDLFVFCGAGRTSRFSGSGSQPQNLKNSGPDCQQCNVCGHIWATPIDNCPKCNCTPVTQKTLEWGNTTTEAALATMATRDLGIVEAQWGDAVDVIASCMRGLFTAAPGHDLICSDYSAIEAVVLAAMAGEEWRLEVFRTHGKIYETSASKITGIPLEEILEHKERTGKHHPLRKKIGKIAELGSGYGGWVNAWKNFGAGDLMTDDEIRTNILKWREESPAIVEMWGGQWRKVPERWQFTPELYGTEGAVISALQQPGKCFQCCGVSWGHDMRDDVLYGLLPSGRKLSYHQPRLTLGMDPRRLQVQKITFMGWNSNPAMGPVGWSRMETYGSRIVENLVQATSRDILRDAMLRLDAAGYPPVLHVHDEVICEVPEGFGSVEEFERIMMVREPWFKDWPIRAAGGWRGKRYRK